MQGRNRLSVSAILVCILALIGGGWTAALAQGKTSPGPPKPAAAEYTATAVNGLPDDLVWTIAFDGEDRPWVGTYRGGAVLEDDGQGEHWQSLTADGLAGDSVLSYLFTPDGRMWVGTDRGVDVFDTASAAAEKVAEYSWNDGMAASSAQDLALDAAGNIWAAHLAEGVSRWDGEEWRKFTVDDGLADNWVYSIAVDDADSVWFGTGAGVSVFDDATWRSYTTGDGLAGEWVSSVAAAPDGELWFATDGGVSEFDGETWTTHLAGRNVHAVAAADDGKVWAAGSGFVSYWDGKIWYDVQPALFADQLVIAVAPRADGEVWVGSQEDGATILTPKAEGAADTAPADATLWVGTQSGVVALRGDEQRRFDTGDGLAGDDVRDILIDKEGRKWFATDGGASMYDGWAWTAYYPSSSSISSNYVQAVAVDPQDRVWFAYGDRGLGLSVKDGDEWRQYTANDGLADEHVYSIAFDGDGRTYAGTADGVFRLNGTRWVDLSAQPGAPGGKIEALAVAPTGELWAGLRGGVAVYDGKTWTTFGADEGLTVGPVRAITFDDAGEVWVGAAPSSPGQKDGGLFVYDGDNWTAIDMNRSNTAYSGAAAQPSGDWISDLLVDADGQLWVGALSYPLAKPMWVVGGVSTQTGDVLGTQLNDVGWTNYTTDNGLVSDYVTALAVDTKGRVWVGTQHGLNLFDGKTWNKWTAASLLPTDHITSLAAAQDGKVWIATDGGGVLYFDGESGEYLTTLGLADRSVNALAEDRQGNIWFATAGGVSRFDGADWRTFTTVDGLAHNDNLAIVVDGDGSVWVGGSANPFPSHTLSRFDGELWSTYRLSSSGRNYSVAALAVARDGKPWVAVSSPNQFSSSSALFRFDGEGWVQAAEPGPLSDDQVYALAIDAGGAVWLGTDGSYDSAPLLLWDGEAWSSYPEVGVEAVLAITLVGPGHGWLGADIGLARLGMKAGQITLAWEPALRETTVQAVALEETDAP